MAATDIVNRAFNKVFGSRNDRVLKRYGRVADAVDALEDDFKSLSPEALRAKTDEFRARLADGEPAKQLLPEAFATVREASKRAQAHRHFNCQLIGGQVLYDRCVAEMRTGEGKTIVCHLAAYLNVLEGKKVHIITVNDYLVKRDAEFARPIFELLGVTVGYIQSQLDPGGHEGLRQQAYACDITYGTNSEFGFDYLRDNMKLRLEDQVQGRLDFAVIDEVDSILIDEARTPLIISGPAHDDVSRYKWADNLARFLVRKQTQANNDTAARLRAWGDSPPADYAANPKFDDAVKRFRLDSNMLIEEEAEAIGHVQYYVVQADRKAAHLTHEGVAAAQEEAGIGSFYIGANMDRPHLIENALRAHTVYERDKEYVVQDRQVIIVDEFTGRLMHGRQWSDGLHQAVEAREGVPVKEETQTLATITLQNFFKLYDRLCGMTGTALTESEEFMKIYRLEVVSIPTNRPVNRVEHHDRIYRSIQEKYDAIVEEIHEIHRRGRPNDPFLLARLLKALERIEAAQGRETDYIVEALAAFNRAENEDQKVVEQMMEAYDRAMGDLAMGRPILVGTTSVENSEKLSNLLERRYGIPHEVLNAKQHEREAEIVAKAGYRYVPERGHDKKPRGNVTIATNMAGRGTDIKLEEGVVYRKCVGDLGPGDGRPPSGKFASWHEPGIISTKCCIHCADYDPATDCAHCWKPKIDSRFPALGRQVCALNAPCGLHIIGTERHEARRIDNQLRGRSGRQGDPGSSRFFLSLQDDLLKLFMPDWMLKMMEKLGFTEGTSLEDKRISKGIERAQKKVEERNFGIRKHLLEWDEPMDYQRKSFYTERQNILANSDQARLVWRMIDESIDEAVNRYFAPDFRSRRIADWCRTTIDVNIEPDRLDADSAAEVAQVIREKAKDEARENIRTSLEEYVDPEAPPNEWDVGGLQKWAQRAFGASLTQNQLRRMVPRDIEDALTAAAEQHFDDIDLSLLEVYFDEKIGQSHLAEWVRQKFGVELTTDELVDRSADEARDLVRGRVEAAYKRRELTYPVEVALDRAFGEAAAGATADSAYAAQQLVDWVNAKFNLAWKPESVQTRTVRELYDELVEIHNDFVSNGRLAGEVDAVLGDAGGASPGVDRSRLASWARERFGPAFREEALADESADPREVLLEAGRSMLRWELSQLERYVLLRIYDQAWKDHLREMDHLKHAIMQRPLGGDQTHPQSQYAIEGRDYFDQMWGVIRERVTDAIFKVKMVGAGPAPSSAPLAGAKLAHADSTGAGFAGAATDQQAAMRAQGQQAKTETIRREQPKVGRNAPCPCGSGKKYKHCCGRQK